MPASSLESVMKILQKHQNKVIPLSLFEQRLQSVFGEDIPKGKIYKLTHQLKNKWYLLSLKKDILYIKMPDTLLDPSVLEEKFYWTLLKSHCKLSCAYERYLGGLNALELHLHMHALIPEEVMIVNAKKQSTEIVMFDKKVNFKTYEANKKNLYSSFAKHTTSFTVQGVNFSVAQLELAILECLYSPSLSMKSYIESLILKAIKAYQATFSFQVIERILALGKHSSSANRLTYLLRPSYPQFADQLILLIKKHWYLQ